MTNALCLQVSGPNAEIALAALESFLVDLGIGLRELQSTSVTVKGTKGGTNSQVLGKRYAFIKDVRDWSAAALAIGTLLLPTQTAQLPETPDYVEQVQSVSELLGKIRELDPALDFSLEVVDSKSGLSIKLDKHASAAEVIQFCTDAGKRE